GWCSGYLLRVAPLGALDVEPASWGLAEAELADDLALVQDVRALDDGLLKDGVLLQEPFDGGWTRRCGALVDRDLHGGVLAQPGEAGVAEARPGSGGRCRARCGGGRLRRPAGPCLVIGPAAGPDDGE